jgi:hypothetical protein
MGKKLRYGYGFNKSALFKIEKELWENWRRFMEPFGYGGTWTSH